MELVSKHNQNSHMHEQHVLHVHTETKAGLKTTGLNNREDNSQHSYFIGTRTESKSIKIRNQCLQFHLSPLIPFLGTAGVKQFLCPFQFQQISAVQLVHI